MEKGAEELSLLYNIVKKRELEEKYGQVSSLKVPFAYTQMAELQREIDRISIQLSKKVDGVSEKSILKIYDEIAKDVRTIHHMTADEMVDSVCKGIVQFHLYDMHTFLDKFVLRGEKNELFCRMFWASSLNDQVEFLKNEYLCDYDIYFTRFLDYLVLFEVDEVRRRDQLTA